MLEARVGPDLNKAPWLRAGHCVFGLERRKAEGRLHRKDVDKAKITVPLLISALFYDLTPDRTVTISSQSERRERDLQDLFRRAKKPAVYYCAPREGR